jgi:hypothetical protein
VVESPVAALKKAWQSPFADYAFSPDNNA